MIFLTFLFVLALLLAGYAHPITAMTQDLGEHLLTGKLILTTHHIPKTNLFSFTYPNFPFLNHHWLSQVAFYLVFSSWGTTGLFFFKLFIISLMFATLVLAVRKRVSPAALALVSLISLPILFERTDIRPELFSFLFLAVFTVFLYAYRSRQTRLLLLLVPLELLWVNLHIYFIVGIALFGIFALDELYLYRKKLRSPHSLFFFLVFLLTALATLGNPHSLTGALYPFNVFKNYGYSIEENQNVFFLQSFYFHWSIFFFWVLVLLSFFSFLLTRQKRILADWLTLIAFAYLGASAVRNMPLFVLAMFIPLSLSLTDILKRVRQRLHTTPPLFPVSLAAGIFLLAVFNCNLVGQQGIGYQVAPGAERGVNFLEREHIAGHMFNNFDIGSYLIYRLYPREKVFVDGRPEAYPASFFQNVYIPMQENQKTFDRVAKTYDISVIFFSHTDQTPWATTFLTGILKNPRWQPIYLDDYVIILLKKSPANASVLSRFGMTDKTLHATLPSHPTEKQLLQLAYFYDRTGEEAQARRTYEMLLSQNPTSCPALTRLAVLESVSNPQLSAIYGQQVQTHCQQ